MNVRFDVVFMNTHFNLVNSLSVLRVNYIYNLYYKFISQFSRLNKDIIHYKFYNILGKSYKI